MATHDERAEAAWKARDILAVALALDLDAPEEVARLARLALGELSLAAPETTVDTERYDGFRAEGHLLAALSLLWRIELSARSRVDDPLDDTNRRGVLDEVLAVLDCCAGKTPRGLPMDAVRMQRGIR